MIKLPERLHSKYVWDELTDCMIWTAHLNAGGYGVAGNNLQSVLAHRLVFQLAVGEIAAGLTLDHLCRNIRCVNPDHLEPVTAAENVRRSSGISTVFAARTHCPACQFPLSGENLRMRSDGGRRCRNCENRRHREYRKR